MQPVDEGLDNPDVVTKYKAAAKIVNGALSCVQRGADVDGFVSASFGEKPYCVYLAGEFTKKCLYFYFGGDVGYIVEIESMALSAWWGKCSSGALCV